MDVGDSSDPFPVINGVKQGCVLAPTLFHIMFSAMLFSVFQVDAHNIALQFDTDGKLFNPGP